MPRNPEALDDEAVAAAVGDERGVTDEDVEEALGYLNAPSMPTRHMSVEDQLALARRRNPGTPQNAVPMIEGHRALDSSGELKAVFGPLGEHESDDDMEEVDAALARLEKDNGSQSSETPPTA